MINPYDQYKQQSILTMTAGEMVVKLYDAIIMNGNKAIIAIEKKDFQTSNKALIKIQDIFSYLLTTLNTDCEIGRDLDSLYRFFIGQIIESNINKDTKPIASIIEMITGLRDAYAEAEKIARQRR
ncbi:MAG: flagellar export chaperone FliS [Oscillospiraceae bacterium]